MTTATSTEGQAYSRWATLLHWAMAMLLVATFALGAQMTDLPSSGRRTKLFDWHQWMGVTVLGLAAMRLLERVTRGSPNPLTGPSWERVAAHAAHLALYVLFFAVPLLGWAYSNADGVPVVYLGLLEHRDLMSADPRLADALQPWHGRSAGLMALLVLLHVAAVAKQQFVDRNAILSRLRLLSRYRSPERLVQTPMTTERSVQ
jgi:cytochrome b561